MFSRVMELELLMQSLGILVLLNGLRFQMIERLEFGERSSWLFGCVVCVGFPVLSSHFYFSPFLVRCEWIEEDSERKYNATRED